MIFRRNQDVGLFDKENTFQELLGNGDPFPKWKEIIVVERFRNILESVFSNTGRKSNAGRKPIDPVFLFKVLFLQRLLYRMSQAQIEYPVKDRTSFRDFRGIQSVDEVPDGKTVWKYKEALARSGMYDSLFKRFNEYLDSIGLIVNVGKIVDASFVIAHGNATHVRKTRRLRRARATSYGTTILTRSAIKT